MFKIVDNTYNDIREKSLKQWLSEMEQHEDVAVRGGVRLCRDYLSYLKKQNEMLQEEKKLRDSYLRKLKDQKSKET